MGKRLDTYSLYNLRRQWAQFSEVGETGEPKGTATLELSCVKLHGFAQECPAWDPNAASLAIRACGADLDAKLAAAERELDMSVAGSAGSAGTRPLRLDVSGPVWPDSGLGDRGVGTAAARVRELSPADPRLQRFDALRAEVAALQDAETRFRDARASCVGLDQLAEFAKQAGGRVATYLDRVGQEERRAHIGKIEAEFSSAAKKAPNMMSADLAELTAEVAAVKAGATELACLDSSRGERALADADAWAQLRTKAIAEEQVCRDSAPCMKSRLTLALSIDLCAILDSKRNAQANVAEIRRNGARFGVIDVVELKEASDVVVLFEQQYKENAAEYRQRIGKAFSPSVCKKLAQ